MASHFSLPDVLRAGSGAMPRRNNEDFGEYESLDDEERPPHGDGFSANGIEHAEPNEPGQSSSGSQALLRVQRDHDVVQARNTWFNDLTNKLLPPEQTELMVKRLSKQADEQFGRTYVRGVQTGGVDESAIVIDVGLSFLPGADKPQVNRLEQVDMTGKPPHQKDAMWRVYTAGSLLTEHDTAQDLSIIQTEKTARVVDDALDRRHNKLLAGSRKAGIIGDLPANAVTISSERVTLVHDLRDREGRWDLESMLIEVDGNSLTHLMIGFRQLISIGGPQMSFQDTKCVLEQMIEDARRLCIRSPILFRMATRQRIISSKITRYGVDHALMFRTLTTSKGIREIISLSASYYNSLDPTGSDDNTQKFIRPRFLQMVVLLLSLVNNEDLAEMKEFLESTYSLKADRRSLELTILKVIPLVSINPRVFMKSLIPAIEGWPLSHDDDSALPQRWDIFIKRLVGYGYILPASLESLGREKSSWIVKWDDFKANPIFRHLQFCGRLKTMNDIPPMQLHPSDGSNEITVVMTDHKNYVVSAYDLEQITCLVAGDYPVQEANAGKRLFDLVVQEEPVNLELYDAIRLLNLTIEKYNKTLTSSRGGEKLKKVMRRSSRRGDLLNEIPGPGRLTKHTAKLCGNILATAYKTEGRKLNKVEATRDMARDIGMCRSVVGFLEDKFEALSSRWLLREESRQFQQSLEAIRNRIRQADGRRVELMNEDELSEEPIAQTIYPEGGDGSNNTPWYDYRAWCQDPSGVLGIEAKQVTVSHVTWLNDALIELWFSQQSTKVFVSPLNKVFEAQQGDEVRVGDIGLLVGQFLAIGEPDPNNGRPRAPMIMTNFLKITGQEEPAVGRRGMNRGKNNEVKAIAYFK